MAFAETAKLAVELTLKDKMTPGLRSAQASLSKFSGTADRLKSTASTTAHNLSLIGVAAGGIIAANVGLGIKSLLDLERVTKQTEGAIASQGGTANITAAAMRDLSNELEDLTTADDKAIQGGLNLLIPYKQISAKTFPRAAKAATNLAIALAEGDVEAADFAASAKLVGKALSDPVKGLTALRRAGIVLTSQQEDLVKSLTKAGKTAEAQDVILAALEERYGKVGQAAGQGLGGDLRRFKDAVEEAQMALATGLLPVISRLSRWLKEKLADPKVMADIKGLGEGLAKALDSVLSAAERIPWDSIANAMRLAGTGAKAALDFFTGLPPWVQTAVLTGWGLNKLTGGALSGVLGSVFEIGLKSLASKLGFGATGTMQVAAGVVNVAGGGGLGTGVPTPTGGGLKGALGTAAKLAIPVAISAVAIAAANDLANALNPGVSERTKNLGNRAPLANADKTNPLTSRWNQYLGRTADNTAATRDATRPLADNDRQLIASARAQAASLAAQKAVTDRMLAAQQHSAGLLQSINAKNFSPRITVPVTVNTSVTSRVSISDYNKVSAQYAVLNRVRAI